MIKKKEPVKITGFTSVFEQKLERLIHRIKEEYKKPKDQRNKENLKRLAREAKDLRKLVKECKADLDCVCCPNCGHSISL